jgi:hypothetical protein
LEFGTFDPWHFISDNNKKITSMTTHTGKIGRLSKMLRDKIGQWIEDGVPGTEIVEKLNALPTVKELCDKSFGGRPVTEQNLSEWKQTGHLVWLRRQEMRQLAVSLTEQSDDLKTAARGTDIGDRFARVLAAEMTSLGMTLLEAESDPQKRWQQLCEIRRELSFLRRDDHRGVSASIKREQWDREVERARDLQGTLKSMFPSL